MILRPVRCYLCFYRYLTGTPEGQDAQCPRCREKAGSGDFTYIGEGRGNIIHVRQVVYTDRRR